MRKPNKHITAFVAGIGLIAVPAAFGQFDTLEVWGDATTDNGGDGPATFTSDGTTTVITAGGADYWGGSDQAAFAWDSNGAHTTTGDFTASVRLDGTTNPASNGWGRDVISARATQTPGTPAANDAHTMAVVRSNGLFATGWRDSAGGNTGRDDGAFPQFAVTSGGGSAWMSVTRSGNDIITGYALDFGGTPGRWVQHASRQPAALAGGIEVVVGLGHQGHTLDAPLDNASSNTATFSNWAWSAAPDPSKYGAPAGPGSWEPRAALNVDPNTGAVSGRAFIEEGGVATGEATSWNVSYTQWSTTTNPGLQADIYLAGNPGNQAGARGIIAGAPAGSTVLPNVDWRGNNGTDSTNPAPYNQGAPGDFIAAVPTFSPTNQDSYGVHMRGEIYIPDDAGRGGLETVSFKDGIDDYTFLGVDGVTLVDDNGWTDWDGAHVQGGNPAGSPIATLDVSDPKFDDGEWVLFEMIMWEGGGGDNGKLFWDANGGAGFPASDVDPATNDALVPAANFRYRDVLGSGSVSGTAQVGDESSDGSFGLNLGPGFYTVDLSNANTGAAAAAGTAVTVVPEPGAVALIALTGLAFIFRRRK